LSRAISNFLTTKGKRPVYFSSFREIRDKNSGPGERIKRPRIRKGYTSYEYFAHDHNISRAQLEYMRKDRI
jgi:hypothetical protein